MFLDELHCPLSIFDGHQRLIVRCNIFINNLRTFDHWQSWVRGFPFRILCSRRYILGMEGPHVVGIG